MQKTTKKPWNHWNSKAIVVPRGWDPHLMVFRKYSRLTSFRYSQLVKLLIFVTHFVKTILNHFGATS